ncbi:MAG TPA: hypothetical protein VD884_09840 [Ohtaekwangia sp.]|nr:hypothetical protein [Ohtaekwangia sp.]
MRYLKFFVLLSTLLLVYSGCDNADDPDTTVDEPYFTIDVEARDAEEWIFITNTTGGLVGYQRIPKEGASVTLSERMAKLSDKMNVYRIFIRPAGEGDITGFSCRAFLGVDPGLTYKFRNIMENPSEDEVINQVEVENPPSSSLFYYSGRNFDTEVSGDFTTYEFERYPVNRELFGYFSGESMLYAEIADEATTQQFLYPDDFKTFDHEIEVPTGSYPTSLMTTGYDEGETTFTDFYSPQHFEALEADQSIKFCYLDGFESYQTAYSIGNKWFFKRGDIATVEEATIPDYDLTVINSSLTNFEATAPSAIHYRASTYSMDPTADGNLFGLTVHSAHGASYQFDLTLPDEFIDEYIDIPFFDMKYDHTTFVQQLSLPNGYENSVLRNFDNTLVGGHESSYSFIEE